MSRWLLDALLWLGAVGCAGAVGALELLTLVVGVLGAGFPAFGALQLASISVISIPADKSCLARVVMRSSSHRNLRGSRRRLDDALSFGWP
ncbi:MAG: hypothetical protein ACTICQ_05160 [Glutamicibacter arilaitensis]|uniref:hypothetical protein n=1 Tax=Glutamicibacter arilaitensis TaxID=256701 RepID=UPI003FB6A00E